MSRAYWLYLQPELAGVGRRCRQPRNVADEHITDEPIPSYVGMVFYYLARKDLSTVVRATDKGGDVPSFQLSCFVRWFSGTIWIIYPLNLIILIQYVISVSVL